MRRFDTVYPVTFIVRTTLDIASVGSKGTVQIDIVVANALVGMHVISYAPTTLATSLDDLIMQWMIVQDGFIRVVLSNNSAGSIDPDPIDFEFLFGFLNPQLGI